MKRRDFVFWILSGLGFLGVLAQRWLKGDDPAAALANTPTPTLNLAAVSEAPLLRFGAIADSGSGNRNQYAVGRVMGLFHQQRPLSLVLMAGDNIYPNGESWKIGEVFERPYKALRDRRVPFYACLGNHDIRLNNGNWQVTYPEFNMQGRYYTVRSGPVQFFALDTNGNANWVQQMAWLERELQQSTAPHKVVFGHHPIYSSGIYGTNAKNIQRLTPLFKKYGVQLYLNGHEHHYERTRPIDGTAYLVVGNAGAHLRPVGRSDWTEYAASRYGFTVVELYRDRVEILAIGTDGTVFDHGKIPLSDLTTAPTPV